jgi:hypothetical protein
MSRAPGLALLVAVALALALGACATSAGRGPAPANCTAESLLAFSERFGGLSAREAEAAGAEARAAFQRTGSDCDRLRLALALAHPEGKAHRDDAQALKLLNGYFAGRGPKEPGLAALARYAAEGLASRTELDGRYRAAAKRAGEERARADALQRKLDELKQIEALLQQRERN